MAVGMLPIEKFGGIRLDLDDRESGIVAARYAHNVDLRQEGVVRRRDGNQQFATLSTERVCGMAQGPDCIMAVTSEIADSQLRVRTITPAGAFNTGLLTGQVAASAHCSFVVTGNGTQDIGYAAADEFGAQMFYTFGTTWTVQGPPGPLGTVCDLVSATVDGRLAVGRSATGSTKVAFSNALAPTVFGADDWVALTPGDGEPLMGMVFWNRNLYVFKRTKMFVFGAPSTDSVGGAVFDYRVVEGLRGPTTRNCVGVGRNGIYVVNREGLFRTRGGEMERVSGAVQRWFDLDFSITPAGMQHNDETYFLTCADDYVHIDQNGETLRYDERDGSWTTTSEGPIAACEAWLENDGKFRLYTAYSNGNIRRMEEGFTTDNGTAYEGLYESNYYDIGKGAVSTLRRSGVDGIGNITVNVATDDLAFNPVNERALVMGALRPARGWRLHASSARRVRHQIKGTTPWQVHRMEHHVNRPRSQAVEV